MNILAVFGFILPVAIAYKGGRTYKVAINSVLVPAVCKRYRA